MQPFSHSSMVMMVQGFLEGLGWLIITRADVIGNAGEREKRVGKNQVEAETRFRVNDGV